MDIKARHGNIHENQADTLIIYTFESSTYEERPLGNATRTINDLLNGAVADLFTNGDFGGKAEQVAVLYSRGTITTRRIILVGLGTLDKFNADIARRAAAQGLQKARDLRAKVVATVPLGTSRGGLDVTTSAQAVTEGALLGLYQYHGQKTSPAPEATLETLQLMILDEANLSAAQTGIDAGIAIAESTILTRNLVNLPPNICTPSYLAQIAQDIAKEVGLKVEVLEEQQMRALKMGALLAVTQGSDTPPRFIILEHNAARAAELDTIVLVGKGVTFDTGGYSLKTFEGMSEMKCDMAGAAAVIGAMQAIAKLNLPLHVVGLAPSTDNMINGHAYRPQEVVTASNGTTIEVISTDAEGRMLLADALVYAGRYKPAAVVDIATLTGSCVIALGAVAAGVFSTDDRLYNTLVSAGDKTNEKLWRLPLFPEYEKALESQTADLKHTGGRTGGVGTSATFLKHFTSYPAWAHIDMAGMAIDATDTPYIPGKGATGYGVRLLTEFVRQWADDKS